MESNSLNCSHYHRYHIDTENIPDIVKWPTRFKVEVGKPSLAMHLIQEVLHTRGNMEVVFSRPCMYGVFSGPVGGFAPRPQHCVGCLRCTTEYHKFVRVSHNPERAKLGDDYFTSSHVDTIAYEAETGMIPVKGAGYRGRFGGEGWDGMWTDMSEIVRPTRDGIHGREYISTIVDIGYRPNYLVFDEGGLPVGPVPHTFQVQLPILFDTPPKSIQNPILFKILAQTAKEINTCAFMPLEMVIEENLESKYVVPLIRSGEESYLDDLIRSPRMIEMDGWDKNAFQLIASKYPETLTSLRIPFTQGDDLLGYYQEGIRVFHLLADYHGRGQNDLFVLDLIRAAHKTFVDAGIRQEVTLLGSGGMIVAEHIPKAVLCGLDAVAIDTPALVALQAEFSGNCANRETSQFQLPLQLKTQWGIQRLKNLAACWHDQLLEIMGAMGLREVRRMRGEMGRAMFMKDLEAEAFSGVEGYEPQ
jgi:hypothetical protein